MFPAHPGDPQPIKKNTSLELSPLEFLRKEDTVEEGYFYRAELWLILNAQGPTGGPRCAPQMEVISSFPQGKMREKFTRMFCIENIGTSLAVYQKGRWR